MSVEVSGNIIRFNGSFRPISFGDFLRAMDGFLLGKPGQLILDFSNCTEAFPNTMLPTIAMVARFRQIGYEIFATLPNDKAAKTRFMFFNWAHLLSPKQYSPSDDLTEPHLVCRQYRTDQEHYAISHGIIDLITKTVNAPRSALGMLDWVINELMDNVINHSQSEPGGFAQLAIFPPSKKFAFCVADCGTGILSSLKTTYPQLTSDRIAIQEAVKAGVTRDKSIGQGNGLSGSLTLAIHTGGRFAAISGKAEVLWTTDEPIVNEQDTDYYGTMIDIQLPYHQEVDFSKLLNEASRSPHYVAVDVRGTDWIDTKYTSEDGKYLVLEMLDEIENAGFGSRSTGKQMRVKALYLIHNCPDMPIVISWRNVPVIASSYADEFIGKLFVELGPVAFNARVRLINMVPVVQDLINRAIMQRIGQTMSGG